MAYDRCGAHVDLPAAGDRGIADEIFSDRAFPFLIHLINHGSPALALSNFCGGIMS
jgi:hypothetical protein